MGLASLLQTAWKHPPSFHLAIWSGKFLCGLAVGRVSERGRDGLRDALSIGFVESAHDSAHPLRGMIAPLAVAAGEAYGRSLGARRMRLVQPLSGVLALYQRLGFDVVRDKGVVLYCERRILP